MKTLKEQAADLKAQMLGLVDASKAAGRDLTAAEGSWIEDTAEKVRDLNRRQVKAEESAALMAKLVKPVGPGYGGPDDSRTSGGGVGSSWSKAVMAQMDQAAAHLGVKALLSGEVGTPAAVEIADLPLIPLRLLDLVARTPLEEGNTFTYLRQTVLQNNAAVVADGAVKPTSTYTFQEVEDRARVVAHLSEPFPLRYLNDHEGLADVLDSQMLTGVLHEVEHQLVAGDGLGENFTGILSTAGVTDVAFATDVLTTIRHARTVLEGKNENPTAWVFNPVDLEALDLMREDGATGGFLMDSAAADTIFGPGVKRVSSLAVPAGTALLADWSQVRVRVREGASTLAATQAGDLWSKNQVQLRSEGRYCNQMKRPQAVAVVHLVAA